MNNILEIRSIDDALKYISHTIVADFFIDISVVNPLNDNREYSIEKDINIWFSPDMFKKIVEHEIVIEKIVVRISDNFSTEALWMLVTNDEYSGFLINEIDIVFSTDDDMVLFKLLS